jgi:hypothetical protein
MESKFWQHDSSSSSNDDDGIDENKFIDSESDDETVSVCLYANEIDIFYYFCIV